MTVSENQIDLSPPLEAASPLEQAAVFGSMGDVGGGMFAERASPLSVERPSFIFLGIVSALTLFADIATKAWAEVAINQRGFEPIEIVDGYLSIILAYNRGGAWGLLHNASELVRRPFFLCVSAAAILFIVSLYAKLVRSQKALSWGLPLVLGGALGNLSDRISRSQVIDFIDFHADWVLKANAWVAGRVPSWTVTDHWPTFNVADVAICIGVGLMAVDMMGKRAAHAAPGGAETQAFHGDTGEGLGALAPALELGLPAAAAHEGGGVALEAPVGAQEVVEDAHHEAESPLSQR